MMDSGTVSSCMVSFLILAATADVCNSSLAKLNPSLCLRLMGSGAKKSVFPVDAFDQLVGGSVMKIN